MTFTPVLGIEELVEARAIPELTARPGSLPMRSCSAIRVNYTVNAGDDS